MTQYLLSMYHPDGPIPPPEVLAGIMAKLRVVNEEMAAANAWVFAGGLCPSSTATVVRVTGADALITDGPYIEGKEHLGGFTVIRAADLDEALGWARKISDATTLPIEVRPFRHGGATS